MDPFHWRYSDIYIYIYILENSLALYLRVDQIITIGIILKACDQLYMPN